MFQIALKSIKAHKARTALTVLEIMIGIAAVIIVFSAGEGIRGVVIGQIETFGDKVIEIEVKVPSTAQMSTENAMGIASGISITTLKDKEAETIKKELPNVIDHYAGIMDQRLVTYKGIIKKAMLFGTGSSAVKIDKTKIVDGRYFTKEEDNALRQVAVLGPTVKETLFGDSDAVGKTIKIGKNNFHVIGVMEERGTVFGMDMDNFIYLPLKTLQKRIMGVDYVTFMMLQMRDESMTAQTVEETKAIMRRLHNTYDPKKEDFAVISMAEARAIMDNIINGLEILLLVLVAISLVVGGVGIMNVIYVSVVERTPEIGLRKAVGATNQEILWQFMWESVIVSVIGGIIGTIIGVVASFIMAKIAISHGYNWKFIVPVQALFLSIGFSAAVGVIFGVFPARKAARLDPISALRHE